jgi:hypothetical protein
MGWEDLLADEMDELEGGIVQDVICLFQDRFSIEGSVPISIIEKITKIIHEKGNEMLHELYDVYNH